MQHSFIGQSIAEIEKKLSDIKLPNYKIKQIWQWVYQKGVFNLEQMTNLSKKEREMLASVFSFALPEIVEHQQSVDGTEKWLLKYKDTNEIECVYIPEEKRGTLCVSSQVGCTLSCTFCHTGTQKLVRNLDVKEVLEQVLHAKASMGDFPVSQTRKQKLTNIVFMGMGEPLYNYPNVSQAIKILMDPAGLAFSKRRITLSTSGVVPMIEKCGQELGVNLAISLHATTNDLRDKIMPINKKYPIEDLLQACRQYPGMHENRKITFEYVMLKDVNDTDEDAKRLIKLLKDIPAKVNIIPFNHWPGSEYVCSDKNRIKSFARILGKAGVDSPIRSTRGEDILAACGQLKSESEKIRASVLKKKELESKQKAP